MQEILAKWWTEKSVTEKNNTSAKRKTEMIRNIFYIIFLLCNVLLLLWDKFEALFFMPLIILLWLAGMVWGIMRPIKAIRKKEQRWYWAFLPLFCIIATAALHFFALTMAYLERTNHLSLQAWQLPGNDKKSVKRKSDFTNQRAHSSRFPARWIYTDRVWKPDRLHFRRYPAAKRDVSGCGKSKDLSKTFTKVLLYTSGVFKMKTTVKYSIAIIGAALFFIAGFYCGKQNYKSELIAVKHIDGKYG